MTPIPALAERYRRMGAAGAPAASPVQRRFACALAGSDGALRVLEVTTAGPRRGR